MAPSKQNHSDEPVPTSETVSALRIATILVGISITLPAFLVSAEVFSALGLHDGLIALLIGGGLLTLVASLTLYVGARTRLSTYCIIERSFGRYGMLVINSVIALTLIGWFGVTAQMFARVMVTVTKQAIGYALPEPLFLAFGCVLMIVTTLYGFKAIDRLSRLAVPLLLLVLLVGAYFSLSPEGALDNTQAGSTMTIGGAVSILLGGFMVGVTILPDMSRFLAPEENAFKAAFLSYGSGSIIVLLCAGLPALATGNKDLVENMVEIGLGLPALMVVLLATWTTNVNNLYSASLSASLIARNLSDRTVTIFVGLIGAVVAFADILENFIMFLTFLSISIPPLAGIYLIDHFSGRGKIAEKTVNLNYSAFVSWFLGSSFAATFFVLGVNLTTVPALDAMLTSSFVHFLWSGKAWQKRIFRR